VGQSQGPRSRRQLYEDRQELLQENEARLAAGEGVRGSSGGDCEHVLCVRKASVWQQVRG
jgi:hypothetical protein